VLAFQPFFAHFRLFRCALTAQHLQLLLHLLIVTASLVKQLPRI
jgi:hypothetical protein